MNRAPEYYIYIFIYSHQPLLFAWNIEKKRTTTEHTPHEIYIWCGLCIHNGQWRRQRRHSNQPLFVEFVFFFEPQNGAVWAHRLPACQLAMPPTHTHKQTRTHSNTYEYMRWAAMQHIHVYIHTTCNTINFSWGNYTLLVATRVENL